MSWIKIISASAILFVSVVLAGWIGETIYMGAAASSHATMNIEARAYAVMLGIAVLSGAGGVAGLWLLFSGVRTQS